MTDKELKKLSRAELLEMLLIQTREVERLKEEIELLEDRLQQRQLHLEQVGSIAEAALQINGIFEAAQAAADQYLENISRLEAKAEAASQTMETEILQKCEHHVLKAEADARRFWEEIREEIRDPFLEHERWMKISSILTGKLHEKIEL